VPLLSLTVKLAAEIETAATLFKVSVIGSDVVAVEVRETGAQLGASGHLQEQAHPVVAKDSRSGYANWCVFYVCCCWDMSFVM
jgi:hypothetical protein